jgi:site-specific DNA-methyltransferase (adenine-specific)
MTGNNMQLILGDCIEEMKKLPADSVSMSLVDIPYDVVSRSSGGLRNLDKGKADELTFDVGIAMSEATRISSGSLYVFCGTEQVSRIRAGFVASGMTTRLCVWEKTNPSPMNGEKFWLSSIECCVFARKPKATFNERCQSAVWRNACARGKLHPTMKPVSLMERLVKASSSQGDVVLDFCMGSGTTGVACVNTGRNFIGIEKDPAYFEIAKRRIEEASNDRK